MTVLFFCNLTTGKLGAFEHLILGIGTRLAAGGDQLIVIFGSAPSGPVPAALREAGIRWGHIEGWAGQAGKGRPWKFVWPALAAIREYKPDLVAVHFGNELPVLVAALISKFWMRRSPIWVWHQRQQIMPPSFLKRRVSRIRLLGLGIDHYVASYEGGCESLRLRGIKPGFMTRIYNGVMAVASTRPPGWLRKELNLPEGAVLAVNVGWLIPRKRIEITIRAFSKVAQRLPHAVLLVVGAGPERATLEKLVCTLNLESRVRFLGARADVTDILTECDCLIHSSIAETCTNVVIESMAAGIPAVIMEAGAAREQIIDGVSGYVVGSNDEQCLAEKLDFVLRDQGLRRAMGEAARLRWQDVFNLNVTAVEHCHLYWRLISTQRAPQISRKMKLLYFCNLISVKTGALEALLEAMGRKFRNAGDDFVVVFPADPIPVVAEALRDAGVRLLIMQGWSNCSGESSAVGFVKGALSLLGKERPDVAVVHFGSEMPTLTVILLSRLMGMGKVKWIWQQDQQIRDPTPLVKHFSRLRLLSFFLDQLVAVYENGRVSMMKRLIQEKKITVIHNPVAPYTPTRAKGWLKAEIGVGADEVMLITNGSLIPRKRIDFILMACGELDKVKSAELKTATAGTLQYSVQQPPSSRSNIPVSRVDLIPPWRLLVIGVGPEREQLVALAAKLGIADRVHFLGLRNDVREIVPECDIYLHAACSEGCSYAITESMAAGIPAVVLNSGAASEQIRDGVSGYVLDSADIGAFSSHIRELLADVSKRVEMGRNSKSYWQQGFSLDFAVSAYRNLHARVVEL